MYTLHQLATATNLSLDDVMAGRRAFQAQDVEKRGALDLSSFVEADLNLQKEVHGTCTDRAKVQHLCGATWEEGETGMDLLKFLTWFANYGFSDDMLLSGEAKWLCRLSRQFQISRLEVENIKRHFDTETVFSNHFAATTHQYSTSAGPLIQSCQCYQCTYTKTPPAFTVTLCQSS